MVKLATGALLFNLLAGLHLASPPRAFASDLVTVACAAVPTVDEFIESFRRNLRIKTNGLTNYLAKSRLGSGNAVIEYSAKQRRQCGRRTVPMGTPLATVTWNTNTKVLDNSGEVLVTEIIDYYDCSQRVSLREHILSQGKNISPVPLTKLVNGEARTFALEPEASRRVYELSDGNGMLLFSVHQTRDPEIPGKTVTSYSFRDQEFLGVTQTLGASQSCITYDFLGYQTTVYRQMSHASNKAVGIREMSACRSQDELPIYKLNNQESDLFILSDHANQFLNGPIFGNGNHNQKIGPLASLKWIMEEILSNFPETEIVRAQEDTRLVDSLKYYHSLLLTKQTDQFIQIETGLAAIIDAIMRSQIVVEDRRPKQ